MTDPHPSLLMVSLHGYVAARPELGRPDTGGQVVYVLQLAQSLARRGYRVDIMTRRFEQQAAVEPVADGVRIVRIAAGGPALIRKEWMCDVVPEWVDGAEAWMRAEGLRYDAIDSHYWDAGLAAAELGRRQGVPHVHTPHSIGEWKRASMAGEPDDLDRRYNFRRRIREERAIYAGADALIATTPQQRTLLSGPVYRVDPRKVRVIPAGYDDQRFFPVDRPVRERLRRAVGHDGPVVLALGRVAASKGYDLLLRAMPTVLERVPRARLRLAVGSTSPTPGERQQVEDLQQLALRLQIADHVQVHDYIPDGELADAYRAADVFVLSSRYEPFGMTAVEAMACGTPTVVTTAGGLWEMLAYGREALYADPEDPSALGHAIAAVLQYPRLAAQLARSGARRARTTFTWDATARQVARLLQDVAPRPAGGPVLRQTRNPWVANASS